MILLLTSSVRSRQTQLAWILTKFVSLDRPLTPENSRVQKKHHTSHSGQKTAKKVEKFSVENLFCYFCTAKAAGAAHRRICAKHMQIHATVLPNLAGKCQILHFFGFFSPLLCILCSVHFQTLNTCTLDGAAWWSLTLILTTSVVRRFRHTKFVYVLITCFDGIDKSASPTFKKEQIHIQGLANPKIEFHC